jgi:hypothetical protein
MLYDSKYEKILCENITLKISKLLNIDHLNYIYANVMQQPNHNVVYLLLLMLTLHLILM